MDSRALGLLDAADGALDVGLSRARQAEDDGPRNGLGDAGYGVGVPLRGCGEASLDHVDPELLELPGDDHLLLHVHGRAWRLLAVAQRRVEDLEPCPCVISLPPVWAVVAGPGDRTDVRSNRSEGQTKKATSVPPVAFRSSREYATDGSPARGYLDRNFLDVHVRTERERQRMSQA